MLPPKKIAPDPDYEVIDFSGEQYSNALPIKALNGKRIDGIKCELCGSMSAKVKCDQCNQQFFCASCDDMFHRHPKRNTHTRKVRSMQSKVECSFETVRWFQAIVIQSSIKPPLPPKGELSMPIAPPRRNKKSSLTPLPTRKEMAPVSVNWIVCGAPRVFYIIFVSISSHCHNDHNRLRRQHYRFANESVILSVSLCQQVNHYQIHLNKMKVSVSSGLSGKRSMGAYYVNPINIFSTTKIAIASSDSKLRVIHFDCKQTTIVGHGTHQNSNNGRVRSHVDHAKTISWTSGGLAIDQRFESTSQQCITIRRVKRESIRVYNLCPLCQMLACEMWMV